MFSAEVTRAATTMPPDAESLLSLFFEPSAASQEAGRRYLERMSLRADREPETTRQTIEAQLAAIRAWGETNGEKFVRLRRIGQPVLAVSGTHDVVIPSYNAYALSQQIPRAQLILCADAGHGALFQDPDWFVHDAARFLDRELGDG